MPTITFLNHQGQSHEVYAMPGSSLMEAAVDNGVTAVVADCGGACSCATCHVYIDPDWLTRLPQPGASEQELLEFAIDLKDNSRLSCQIEVTEEMEGMIVRTPESQY